MARNKAEAKLTPRDCDEVLGPEQLKALSFFSGLNKKPNFEKIQVSVVLRKYKQGEVVFRQADPGATAFVILKAEDVVQLREDQIASAEENEVPESQIAAWNEEREIWQARVARIPKTAVREVVERKAASARLSFDDRSLKRPKSLWQKIFSRSKKSELPTEIPNDGPVDINTTTRFAPLYEGDLFGEMSCFNRTPRSATIVAEQDCYMIEMLRNILDQVHKDPAFKAKSDEEYRRRVLHTHLRRLSFFSMLDRYDFDYIRDRCELLAYEPGSVMFHEHDASDSVYIVRSGLIKVIRNTGWRMTPEQVTMPQAQMLAFELLSHRESLMPLFRLACEQMPNAVWSHCKRLAMGKGDDFDKNELVTALNAVLKDGWNPKKFGKNGEVLLAGVEAVPLAEVISRAPNEFDKWCDIDHCEFRRELLVAMCPRSMSVRTIGGRRILGYFGRGETLGEVGLVTGRPRSATCVAFNHPDNEQKIGRGAGVTPARVEVVRIDRADFLPLLKRQPKLQAYVEKLIQKRLESDEAPSAGNLLQSDPEFENLGLIQGQALMLIDLDRCTRCGDCMKACINTHEDGHSRLYLDGMRFGKYLVPTTCRKCLDPVCMIGCPVGSIQKGPNGEIEIKDWCIGCELCADQCPYGSIHMHLPTEEETGSKGGDKKEDAKGEAEEGDSEEKGKAVVCDLCNDVKTGPACVYHCPHDAAIRVPAHISFPGVA